MVRTEDNCTSLSVEQVYRRTYSWAQNNDEASRGGAYITITRTPVQTRMSEEDLERGCSADMLMEPQVPSWSF